MIVHEPVQLQLKLHLSLETSWHFEELALVLAPVSQSLHR